MAFGEQKKKKTGFENLTRLVIIVMLVTMILGIVATAINALM